ncbi:MAG TPA: hypothetical protein VD962_12520, partial [Rubricoccaceae bacterium]|nr:hypothetical protein [Rubricoccaceae bacterium]
MIADLASSALGFVLGPAVFFLPGYAAGHFANALGFRSQSPLLRVSAAVVFSVALGPLLAYVLLNVGWVAFFVGYAGLGGLGLAACVRGRASLAPLVRPGLVALAVAVALVLCTVDMGGDGRLYFSVVARDYLKHVAVTDVLRAEGVPPSNPFFQPGHPIPLFYYYGWFQLTAALDALGGPLVGPRGAVFAGTAWSGLALMAAAVLWVGLRPNALGVEEPEGVRVRRAVTLLLAGGMDLVVFLIGYLVWKGSGRQPVFTDIEWWNEPVFLWSTSVLTVPHHVGGLVAALAGLLLTRWGTEQGGWKGGVPVRAALGMAAVAFASSALCSVWVAMTAALAAAVWVVVSFVRRDGREAVTWLGVGVLAAVLVLPFVLDLRAAGTTEGFPVAGWVRAFKPVEFLGLPSRGAGALVHLALLPLNYALELGALALTGLLFWRWRRVQRRALSRDEAFLLVVALATLVFVTFARAAVRTNDLGFRGPMLLQFVLLLWAGDVLGALRAWAASPPRWLRPTLTALLVVGVLSTIGNALVLRLVPPAADAGLVAMPGMYAPDRRLGARTHDLRAAYAWVSDHTPEGALVQHDPKPGVPRIEGGIA